MKYHCFFEQSGTFKNEFKKLGYEAYDYDILNDFKQTDYIIDLFEEQIQMHYRGDAFQQKNWPLERKLQNNLKLHKELSYFYELITKLAIICIRKEIPLIIENPYSKNHYLVKYWPIPYTILDNDRTTRGDSFKKPTQYWFINRKPSNNFIFEALKLEKIKTVNRCNKVDRSIITSQYANRFIKEFIEIKGDELIF